MEVAVHGVGGKLGEWRRVKPERGEQFGIAAVGIDVFGLRPDNVAHYGAAYDDGGNEEPGSYGSRSGF